MIAAPLRDWLALLVARGGADLYLTFGAPPVLRGDFGMSPARPEPLTDDELTAVFDALTLPPHREEFARTHELNMALDLGPEGRFRVNVLRQRQHPAVVIRRLTAKIPTLDELKMPAVLGQLALERRGLVLIVGGTGSGKSTTLAAMVDRRNDAGPGHIVTIEDPIEYIHDHKFCIVTQREIGIDTLSWEAALKNALRQKPDMILIGEIRDTVSMRHAINIAETGHLCLATLHANNANQAIERVLNFFDRSETPQVLLNLSLNLRGIVSQRLVPTMDRGRALAMEILLNQGLVKDLIAKGEIRELKSALSENLAIGMQTFDQALFRLWADAVIDENTALAEADVPTDLKLAIQRARLGQDAGLKSLDTSKLSF